MEGSGITMKYFGKLPGQNLKDLSTEWQALTEQDKEQLIQGVTDGTLTY